VIVTARPNYITKRTTIPMIQKNIKKEKKENMKVAHQIMNNEDEGAGRNEKA